MQDSFLKRTNITATIVVTPSTTAAGVTAQVSEFEQLMDDLASGSEEAAWRITETYTPHILRVVRRMLPNAIRSKLDSQDFAQIVWVSLLLKRTYLRHVKSPEQLIALLAKVAQHKVIDVFRHFTVVQTRDIRRETPLEDLVSSQRTKASEHAGAGLIVRGVGERALMDRNLSPSQIAGAREKWQALIGALPPRDRAILKMRIQGKTYSDIADALSICSNTAKRVLDKIIEELRA